MLSSPPVKGEKIEKCKKAVKFRGVIEKQRLLYKRREKTKFFPKVFLCFVLFSKRKKKEEKFKAK